ncbi:hypothetical protein [Tardisphaera saccharovorans]
MFWGCSLKAEARLAVQRKISPLNRESRNNLNAVLELHTRAVKFFYSFRVTDGKVLQDLVHYEGQGWVFAALSTN